MRLNAESVAFQRAIQDTIAMTPTPSPPIPAPPSPTPAPAPVNPVPTTPTRTIRDRLLDGLGGFALASVLAFGAHATQGGCSARPKPVPPKPAPVVAKGHLKAIYVFDPTTLDQTEGQLRSSITIGPKLAAPEIDADWKTFESTDSFLHDRGLDRFTSILPALIIEETTGHVPWSGESPVDEDGVVAKIKALRGLK